MHGNKFNFYPCNYNLQIMTIFGRIHVSNSFGRTTLGHLTNFGQAFYGTATTILLFSMLLFCFSFTFHELSLDWVAFLVKAEQSTFICRWFRPSWLAYSHIEVSYVTHFIVWLAHKHSVTAVARVKLGGLAGSCVAQYLMSVPDGTRRGGC